MAKAVKKKLAKKRQKRTINVDISLTIEQALKVAASIPKKKNRD